MSDKIYITDAQIAGYEQATGVTRNVLCALPRSAQASQPPMLAEAQQAALFAALQPKCVTRAETLLYNDGLAMLLCAARGDNAALIGREDNKTILVPVGRHDATLTMLADLMEGGVSESAKACIKTDGDSFLLLLAIADTYRRQYLEGLLKHRTTNAKLTMEELSQTLADAYNVSDTRWLFPFVLMTLGFPVLEDMRGALDGLYRGGVLKQGSLTLTEDGERFTDELMYLQAAFHLQTQRVRGGALVREDILLLRTHESLWCAIPGEGETTLFTLSAEKMFELVNAISEELDDPQADADTQPLRKTGQIANETRWRCTCGSINTSRFCANCGKQKPQEAAPVVQRDGWRCVCGNLNKGAFCPNCGVKRP